MKKERKHYTAEEKVAILRRHLLDKVPVSDLCEELVGRRCSTAGKRSSSRTEGLLFRLRSVPIARWRRNRNGLSSWRRRSRPRLRARVSTLILGRPNRSGAKSSVFFKSEPLEFLPQWPALVCGPRPSQHRTSFIIFYSSTRMRGTTLEMSRTPPEMPPLGPRELLNRSRG